MTQANLSFIHQEIPLSERWDLLNMMPISYQDFAEYAHLYGRMYGVVTGEERGISGPDGEKLRSFVANGCLRDALYRNLLTVSELTEQQLRYKLSERYLTIDIPWRGAEKLQGEVPAIEKVEVERNWYEIEEDNLVTLNYYTDEDITLFTDGNSLLARVPRALFVNPNWVYLYDETENKMLEIETGHARFAEKLGSDWVLPILTSVTAAADTDAVHAIHQRHLDVTFVTPDVSDLPEDGEIKPVYPDTNQIIPHEVITSGVNTTYRFPIYVLVDPAFADDDEAIIWRRFETYKFLEQFELRYVVEEAAYLELIWTEGDEQTVYQYDPVAEAVDPNDTLPRLHVVISDAMRGVLTLYANDSMVRDLTPYWRSACGCGTRKMPQSAVLRIPIKVNPTLLPPPQRGQLDTIREAILAKVAAELPVEDCGCSPTQIGYIYEQQKPYGKTYLNPYTGIEVISTDYGMRHGQRIYQMTLENVLLWRRPIRVGR